MSKELFNISTPIGIAIQNKEIDKTGILNAVQFPLDERVYESVPKSLLEYMNIKKLKYSSNHFLNDIKKKISGIDELNTVANLRERIEKVTKENEIKEIIVCGFISQAYMELAFSEIKNIRFKTWTPLNVNGAIINIRYTHHPSPKRNGANWSI
ncbi:MAG: hypothetical protein KDD24_02315 [Flavobacteriales bacterium]|nr:hypothetical protein [Flavobacteriales bacterium]MCB9175437.1 hypothetical protein [Flavobacteriales bacterium]